MTPKEKAKELIEKYMQLNRFSKEMARQCALIAVNEILSVVKDCALEYDDNYWQKVESEIMKLW